MEYPIGALGTLLVIFAVRGIIALLSKPKESKDNTVRLPKLLLVIGIVCSAFFLTLLFITLFLAQPLWIPAIFLAFSLLGAMLILMYINYRIEYDNFGFTVTGYFGKKRSFTYDMITGARDATQEAYIYFGEKRVMIDKMAIGSAQFLELVEKKYKALNGGHDIPEQKPKRDIFRGNVKNSGALIFVFAMLEALLIGLLIFVTFYVFAPADPADSEKREAILVSCSKTEDVLVMRDKAGEIYKLRIYATDSYTEAIRAVCDGETELTVYGKASSDEAVPHFSVTAIKSGEDYVLSFEDTRQIHINEFWPIIIFVGGMVALWSAFVGFMIYLGRNPRNFSKKFVEAFFGKEGVKY